MKYVNLKKQNGSRNKLIFTDAICNGEMEHLKCQDGTYRRQVEKSCARAARYALRLNSNQKVSELAGRHGIVTGTNE